MQLQLQTVVLKLEVIVKIHRKLLLQQLIGKNLEKIIINKLPQVKIIQ